MEESKDFVFGLTADQENEAKKVCKNHFKQIGTEKGLTGAQLSKFTVDQQRQLWGNTEELGKFLLENKFINQATYDKGISNPQKQVGFKNKQPNLIQNQVSLKISKSKLLSIKKTVEKSINMCNIMEKLVLSMLNEQEGTEQLGKYYDDAVFDIDNVDAIQIEDEPEEVNDPQFAAFFNAKFPQYDTLPVPEIFSIIENEWNNLNPKEKQRYYIKE